MCNSTSKIRQKQKNMQTLLPKYNLWHKLNKNTFLIPWCWVGLSATVYAGQTTGETKSISCY